MSLLSLTQQQAIKPISQNWAVKIIIAGGINNFVQLEKEIENKELRKLLGSALLYDLQQNSTDSDYVKLLDGTTYTDSDGNTVKFEGIRTQLSYMIYSKSIILSRVEQTFTGNVYKNRNEATAINSGDVKRLQTDAQEIALSDFELMKYYLNENTATYNLWNCSNIKKPFIPKFTTIKKTYY